MARIAGVDIPRDKRVEISLRYIYGIGPTNSRSIVARARVNPDTRVKDLTEEEISRLRDVIEKNVTGGRRSAPRAADEHQAADGDWLLSWCAPSAQSACAWAAHKDQRPHEAWGQEDGCRSQEGRGQEVGKEEREGKARAGVVRPVAAFPRYQQWQKPRQQKKPAKGAAKPAAAAGAAPAAAAAAASKRRPAKGQAARTQGRAHRAGHIFNRHSTTPWSH